MAHGIDRLGVSRVPAAAPLEAEGDAEPVPVAVDEPVAEEVAVGVAVPVGTWVLAPGWSIWSSERGETCRSERTLPLLSLTVTFTA